MPFVTAAGFCTVAVKVTTVPAVTVALGKTANVVDVTAILTVIDCVACTAGKKLELPA
jgi:hypothetical protein